MPQTKASISLRAVSGRDFRKLHARSPEARVRNIQVAQVGELNATTRGHDSSDIGGVHETSIHLAAEGLRFQCGSAYPYLEDRHIFLGFELPVAQDQLGDDIGNRTEAANGEPLAEIFRLRISLRAIMSPSSRLIVTPMILKSTPARARAAWICDGRSEVVQLNAAADDGLVHATNRCRCRCSERH